ncbi:lytic murein transglycosylase [Falsihalocynthiibacter sp. S25ZX9]|uniref:lytic murein transglycosylase n=1 Tax=Falsihalocynthiibacter sp. S25ZX9 TaxID=3240870 RepID=UPI00351064CB
MTAPQGAEGFNAWLVEFRKRAQSAGISTSVLDASLAGISYNPDVVKKDRNQSEFTKQIWEYLDSATSNARVTNGKKALAENDGILSQIEAKFGVEKEIVAAIWGLESAYGTFRGNVPIIESLATLSYDGRRGDFFEAQLIDALKIIQSGDVAPANMTGSWAGAMGHTQFMPSSYLSYAVDFTGDGKRDIWGDSPADALASTAAYLKGYGWTFGQPWGVEVILPKGFDFLLSSERVKKPATVWAQMGVRDTKGKIVPNYGPSSVLLPAGAQGAAFIIFNNFHVIERYNTADAYVIGVGHLADRIAGGTEIQADWPREDQALRFIEKIQMQERLTQAGFDTLGTDGIIGPNTIAAIKAFQASVGMIPDGYASSRVLSRLK